jgi:hypothetical protein
LSAATVLTECAGVFDDGAFQRFLHAVVVAPLA